MKVICVKKDKPIKNHPDLIEAGNKLQVGDFYTVIQEKRGLYELEEFPHPLTILWDKECFAPLSTIDETTFERNYNTQPA